MKKYFILAAIAAVTLASCSTADDEVATNPSKTTDPVAVTLSNSFSKPTTRAINDLQNEQIVSGVQVGVSVFKTGKTTVEDGYGQTNVEFTAGASGVLTIATGSTMYYSTNSNVDIYAYAPLQTVENIATAVDFTVRPNQSADLDYLASDLISAAKLENIPSSSSEQNLTFTHKLSRIKVTLQAGASVSSDLLSSATITIKNTKPTTTFTPSTGAITEAKGTAADITACTNSATGYAIIVPQTLATGTQFINIHIGTKDYIYSIPDASDQTYTGGNQYSYTIQVNTNSITLQSTKITAWTNNDMSGSATN